ncbi:MAG: hypothetical protein IJ438_09520 [Clostridia bacterium]|nr:hypothetical protein [Clostridia bacterium]
MRKVIVSILVCMLCCSLACAEDVVIPQAVQDFYDAVNRALQNEGAQPVAAEITIHTDMESYPAQFDYMWPLAVSRENYDTLYCWKIADEVIVTVAYIGDKPAAYILDSNGILMRGGWTPYKEALFAIPEAYETLYPAKRKGFDGEALLFDGDVMSYDDQMTKQALIKFDNELVSIYRSGEGFNPEIYCLQLMPLAAYEGLEMTAEQYHETGFELFSLNIKESIEMTEFLKQLFQ